MSVKRNTTYNLVGALLPLLAIYLTLPLYLATIGEARYGVLAIIWTLLGYFGLFDLGLGRAVTNRIAVLGSRPGEERERVFWTSLLLNIAIGGGAALLLGLVGGVIIDHWFEASDQLVQEVRQAIPWIALCLPALLASSVLSGALMGREEFLAQNSVRAIEGILIQVLPLLAALYVAPDVPSIVLAVLVVRFAMSGLLFWLCLKRLPVRINLRWSAGEAKHLMVFGGWVTVTSVISPILSTLDRVILGAVAGMRAVTYYTVPFGLVSRLSIIPGSLSTALFPRFSAESDGAVNRSLEERANRALAAFLMPLIVLGVLAMEPFLALWIDVEFSLRSALPGEILLLGIWTNCLAYIPFTRLQAIGRPNVVAKIHLAEVVPYLLLLWIALKQWGVVGAAATWSLRCTVDAILLFRAGRASVAQMKTLLIPTLLIGGTFVLVSVLPWQQPLRWALSAALLVVSGVWAWRNLPEEARRFTWQPSVSVESDPTDV